MAALARGLPVAIGYADCGTYGALDELSARLGLRRLPGLHCYDLLAGPDRVAALFEAEPGTYVLTDFLVRSFRRTVIAGLGLDRYPELWPDYFGHYRRVVWLAQSRDPALEAEARAVAARFGLPLTVIDTGTTRLERELEHLLTASPAPTGPAPVPDPPAGAASPTPTAPVPDPPAAQPHPHPPAPPRYPTHPPRSLTRTHRPGTRPTRRRGRTRTHRPGTRPTRRAAAPAPTAPVPDPPAGAASPPSPLPPPASPIPAGVAGGVVIKRLVLLWEHQSFDHESRRTAATTPGTPQITAAPQAPENPAAEGERCAAGW